jgi:ABC-type phosphate/phosphonate transport system substrate-binding protein
VILSRIILAEKFGCEPRVNSHAPDLAASVRVIDATAASPIPAFVASGLGAEDAARVRAALLGLHASAEGRELLTDVCLRGFAAMDSKRYDATTEMEQQAIAGAYPAIV